MSWLWNEDEMVRTLGAPSAPMGGVAGVSIDTRTLQPGDLFIAIRGDVHDGHDHVEKAFAAGAAAAVVAQDKAPRLASHGPVFAVDDTLRAMERLGVAARARTKARIAAVTGSVGKTSAKEMLRLALSRFGRTHASIASYNNHWGVPLTLARMPADTEFAVFEIGMNHAGEITPLVGFVRPQVAMITTIAPVHIENLGSIEAIADAKAEIFSGVAAGGVAVVNRDAPQFERIAAQASARGLSLRAFGASEPADPRLLDVEARSQGSEVRMVSRGREIVFGLGAPGRHMAENAVGALAVCEALGLDIDAAAQTMRDFAPPKGRGERFILHAPDGPFLLIDESYNANPASMRAALGLLAATTPGEGGRRIAVIGDMLELGPESPALHEALAPDLVAAGVDRLYGAGPLTLGLYQAAPVEMRAAWGVKADDIRAELLRTPRAGDVIMIKGSNGSRMGPLAAALREAFSSTGIA